jgi:hypothetical protein
MCLLTLKAERFYTTTTKQQNPEGKQGMREAYAMVSDWLWVEDGTGLNDRRSFGSVN